MNSFYLGQHVRHAVKILEGLTADQELLQPLFREMRAVLDPGTYRPTMNGLLVIADGLYRCVISPRLFNLLFQIPVLASLIPISLRFSPSNHHG
jgi:hypothetical protein